MHEIRSTCNSTALGFSVDGALLAIGRVDGAVEIWDIAAGKRQVELPAAHAGPVAALGFSWPCTPEQPEEDESGPLMFSGGADGTLQLRRLWASGNTPRQPSAKEVCRIGADSQLPPI